jgi:hypothetical protein
MGISYSHVYTLLKMSLVIIFNFSDTAVADPEEGDCPPPILSKINSLKSLILDFDVIILQG